MPRLDISLIIVPEERQRRDFGDITALAESILRIGLINPITITESHRLVAGERRLRAMKFLGWTSLAPHQYRYINTLSEGQLQAIELEENVKRKDITWQEQLDAVRRYHDLRKSQVPGEWTGTQTASELGLTPSYVNSLLAVAATVESKPELLKQKEFSVARNLVSRERERAAAATVANILDGIEEPAAAPAAPSPAVPIINADFTAWAREYRGPKFNFLHCDFPYGIDFDKQNGQNSANKERYRDDVGYYKDLLAALPLLPVASDAHIMFWFSMNHYALTRYALREAGWHIQDHPLYWGKSDNSGLLPDPKRGPRRNVETAFIGSRGDVPIVQAVSNIWYGARGPADHASSKPRAMLSHFFRMFVDSHTRMLDPTCGSGNAVRAAHDMGAKEVLGIELDPIFHTDAVRRWGDADMEVKL